MKLPDGAPRPARGARVRVTGKLVDPYGQLELRPGAAGDVVVEGFEALPDPLPGSAASLGEATEARLVVLEGTLEAPPARETSGDLVLRLVDDAGIALPGARDEGRRARASDRSRPARGCGSRGSWASAPRARACSTATGSGSATRPTWSSLPDRAPGHRRALRRRPRRRPPVPRFGRSPPSCAWPTAPFASRPW